MEKKLLQETVKYLDAGKVKITADKSTGALVVESGGKKVSGFVCGMLSLVRLQKASLEGVTPLQKCLTQDWLTYLATDLLHCPTHEALNSCLHHVNEELVTRTYLCGHVMTIADVVLFLALHPFITNWSYHQKEQYMNISRWYSCIQNDAALRKSHKPVQFSRTCLYGSSRCH